MKTLAVILIAVVTAGLAALADAQTGTRPSGSASGAVSGPSGSSDATATSPAPPATSDRPGAAVGERTPDNRTDDGAALPRTAVGERTTIFGLSPTAAVVLAAALLVVVILAIVAMTRTSDTYIDTDRRL
jgi:hypothetical protein